MRLFPLLLAGCVLLTSACATRPYSPPPPLQLWGVVQNERGEPVPYVPIEVRSPPDLVDILFVFPILFRAWPMAITTADDLGRFRCDLQPRDVYKIQAGKPSVTVSGQATVIAGSKPLDYGLILVVK